MFEYESGKEFQERSLKYPIVPIGNSWLSANHPIGLLRSRISRRQLEARTCINHFQIMHGHPVQVANRIDHHLSFFDTAPAFG